VLRWADRNEDLVVVFASSMGQGAVHRAAHEGVELLVEDLPSLLRHAGSRPATIGRCCDVPQSRSKSAMTKSARP